MICLAVYAGTAIVVGAVAGVAAFLAAVAVVEWSNQ